MSCHIIRTVRDFSNNNYFVFIVNMQRREQVRPCLSDTASLRRSAETSGGEAETVEKSKLNSSLGTEEKFTVRKTN